MACSFCQEENGVLHGKISETTDSSCFLSIEKTGGGNYKEFKIIFEAYGFEENLNGWGKFDFNFCPFCGENLENIKE